MSYTVTLSTAKGRTSRRYSNWTFATEAAYSAVNHRAARTATVVPSSGSMRWGTGRASQVRFYWRRIGTDLRCKATPVSP